MPSIVSRFTKSRFTKDFFRVEVTDPRQKIVKTAVFLYTLFLCVFIPFRGILEIAFGSFVKLLPDLLLIGLFVYYAITVRLRFAFKVQDFLFLAFFALTAVNSLFLQKSGLMPFVFQVRSMGVYYLLYFLVRHVKFTKTEFSRIVTVLKGVSVLLLLLVLVEKITSKTVLFPSSVADSILYASNYTRAYSMLFNPNTYGLFLVILLIFCLYRQWEGGEKTSALFYGSLGGGILLSMSRSSLLALLIGLVLFLLYVLWWTRGKLPYKKLLCALLVALAVSFALYGAADGLSSLYYREVLKDSEDSDPVMNGSVEIGATDRFEHTMTDEEIQQSSVSGRIYVLQKGLSILKDYPLLGTGLGTYGSAAATNYPSALVEKYELPFPLYSDNEYICILVESGILGMLLFFSFLGALLYSCRKDPLKLIFCLLIGWFGLFYNIFEVQIGTFLLWTLLGTEALSSFPKRKQQAEESPWQTAETV